MGLIEEKLETLGIRLPQPMKLPPGVVLDFPWVRVCGDRAYISGHGPLEADGSLLKPLGAVGRELTEEQAVAAARATGLAIISSLQRTLGNLDRIACWLRVFGMVNAAPGYTRYPVVINGFSDLIVSIWGEATGSHARSAIAVAGLPFGIAVEIEAEIALKTT